MWRWAMLPIRSRQSSISYRRRGESGKRRKFTKKRETKLGNEEEIQNRDEAIESNFMDTYVFFTLQIDRDIRFSMARDTSTWWSASSSQTSVSGTVIIPLIQS